MQCKENRTDSTLLSMEFRDRKALALTMPNAEVGYADFRKAAPAVGHTQRAEHNIIG